MPSTQPPPPVVPTLTLNNGVAMPVFGLGTWKSPPGQVGAAVRHAIAVGYRHIDAALVYENENEVGAAIAEKIADGTVRREDLFVTTKCWSTNHSKAAARRCLLASLASLRLDYVDLYLIHWPMGFREGGGLFPKDDDDKLVASDVDYLETWEAFEEFVDEGLVRSIGVSNFNSEQVARILEKCRIKPAMNQVEIHPYFNNGKLVEFCQSRGVAITAYSPLGSPDRPWAKPDDPSLLNDPKVKAIAEKYNKTPAQVLIRFGLQRSMVVIPKSVTPSRIDENLAVFDFVLSGDDMEAILAFDRPEDGRALLLPWCDHLNHYPFHVPF